MLIAFSEQVIVYFIFKIYPEGSFIVLIDVVMYLYNFQRHVYTIEKKISYLVVYRKHYTIQISFQVEWYVQVMDLMVKWLSLQPNSFTFVSLVLNIRLLVFL